MNCTHVEQGNHFINEFPSLVVGLLLLVVLLAFAQEV